MRLYEKLVDEEVKYQFPKPDVSMFKNRIQEIDDESDSEFEY